MLACSQASNSTHLLNVLDALRCGGILLGSERRVLSLNSVAQGCIGNGLLLVGEHLCAADRDANDRLQHVIGAALGGRETRPSVSVVLPRPVGLPLMTHLLRLDQHDLRSARSAGLLLLVVDPNRWAALPRETLSEAFALTRAEADIAIGVISGRTLSEIAADRGVKVGTARAHLKAVFSKTHARSQADLTGMLIRLAVFSPHTE